jgi:hypothetical protein
LAGSDQYLQDTGPPVTAETFRAPFVSMIRTRHHQPSLWTGVLAEEVEDLWEPWMRTADKLLDDEELVERIFEA